MMRKNWQCLFQRRQSPCSREGRRGTRDWVPGWAGPWTKTLVAPAFFSSGSRGEAVPRADGSPVAAEVWQGSFLRPHFGSNDDTPWASAGHGLAETFSHFRPLVRRMRETNPDSRDRGRGLGPPREHQPPPRGGQRAPSECPGR